MRLKQYYKMWSKLYEWDEETIIWNIDESVNLTTKVMKKSDRKWHFWVKNDLYIVNVMEKVPSHYELSFFHKDVYGNEISSITNKNTPFSVMDGVAVAMKNLIEIKNPKIIEFNVFGEDKKVRMFRKIMDMVIKKHSDIFGNYKISSKETKIVLPYNDTPEELLKNLKGTKFIMERN